MLADYFRISGSFTTTLVRKLIDRGLVEKLSIPATGAAFACG